MHKSFKYKVEVLNTSTSQNSQSQRLLNCWITEFCLFQRKISQIAIVAGKFCFYQLHKSQFFNKHKFRLKAMLVKAVSRFPFFKYLKDGMIFEIPFKNDNDPFKNDNDSNEKNMSPLLEKFWAPPVFLLWDSKE